jgi:hypothetical protein
MFSFDVLLENRGRLEPGHVLGRDDELLERKILCDVLVIDEKKHPPTQYHAHSTPIQDATTNERRAGEQ